MNGKTDNQLQKQFIVRYQGQHQALDRSQYLASPLRLLTAIATLVLGSGFQAAPTVAQVLSQFSTAPLTQQPSASPVPAFDRTLSPVQPNRILEFSPIPQTSIPPQLPQAVQPPFNLVPAQQFPVQPIPAQQTLVPQTLVPQTLVPQTLVPQTLVPQTLVPQTLVPQTLVPQTPTQPTPVSPQPIVDRLVTAPASNIPNLGGADDFLPSERTIRLVIVRSERRVFVYENDELKTSYPVAIGKEGWETPLGTWQVIQMIENPAWEHPFTGEVVPPGIDNPLGARWIGFWTNGKNYIGFHGTPNQESVGQPASHGCVRMYDEDVVALFNLVSLGTTVQVVP